MPDDLQMAELVGWKRGAFTGATRSMPGAITRAAEGTLFIDEIDKLSFKRALAFEHDACGDTTADRLWRAAQALAREAVRRDQHDAEPLTLKMVDGFRGMVLGATVQYLESREQAFRIFRRVFFRGDERLVPARRHHRLRAELRGHSRRQQAEPALHRASARRDDEFLAAAAARRG